MLEAGLPTATAVKLDMLQISQRADNFFATCRTGWAYPWAVRIRLADLMLRGLFDTLDEASYVESKDALLQLLQTRVWPLLGISPQIHSTIYAWIHFRQFAVTGVFPF